MTVLVTIRPGLVLEAQAAESWARMERQHGGALDVNRATVSRAEQQQKYDAYLAYRNGGPWAPLALPPDKSWHCPPRARAVDTDDDAWVRAHPEHGWRFVVKAEKWHAQYYPEHDTHPAEPAGGDSRPLPEETEDDMATALLTVGVAQPGGPNQYWSLNMATNQAFLIHNGTQLEFRRALGIVEHVNQSPAILDGFEKITE